MAALMRIDGLTLLTMDGNAADPIALRTGSLRIEGERIAELGTLHPVAGEESLDGSGLVAVPGFVQGHLHCCQTLFRGLADDLPLLEWLRRRIWPLEAAHDAASARASARLSLQELLSGGTTCVQVMESVRHAEECFLAAREVGITAIVGNCLMDVPGEGVPAGLTTSAAEALSISDQLRHEFHRPDEGLCYAVSPRFILSCSEGLARDAAAFARQHGLRIHTHASEHRDELALVQARFSKAYIEALADQGLLGTQTCLAHGVHTSETERAMLVRSDTALVHCPSANLKLGAGIAPIVDYLRRGLRVALGADGAPCNNRLSALTEMREAALLQSATAGPGAFRAAQALWLATRGGAVALGLDERLGSLVPGKRADLVLFDLAALRPGGDPVSQIVWSASEAQIRHVILGGRFVVRDFALRAFDAGEVRSTATRERDRLLQRAGLRA